jgi:hypothetical protein
MTDDREQKSEDRRQKAEDRTSEVKKIRKDREGGSE